MSMGNIDDMNEHGKHRRHGCAWETSTTWMSMRNIDDMDVLLCEPASDGFMVAPTEHVAHSRL
jgi:hypothetical protein